MHIPCMLLYIHACTTTRGPTYVAALLHAAVYAAVADSAAVADTAGHYKNSLYKRYIHNYYLAQTKHQI